VKVRTPEAHFPRDLKDARVPTQAAPELIAAATALQRAFAAGDAHFMGRGRPRGAQPANGGCGRRAYCMPDCAHG
jgi:hypothetical protein